MDKNKNAGGGILLERTLLDFLHGFAETKETPKSGVETILQQIKREILERNKNQALLEIARKKFKLQPDWARDFVATASSSVNIGSNVPIAAKERCVRILDGILKLDYKNPKDGRVEPGRKLEICEMFIGGLGAIAPAMALDVLSMFLVQDRPSEEAVLSEMFITRSSIVDLIKGLTLKLFKDPNYISDNWTTFKDSNYISNSRVVANFLEACRLRDPKIAYNIIEEMKKIDPVKTMETIVLHGNPEIVKLSMTGNTNISKGNSRKLLDAIASGMQNEQVFYNTKMSEDDSKKLFDAIALGAQNKKNFYNFNKNLASIDLARIFVRPIKNILKGNEAGDKEIVFNFLATLLDSGSKGLEAAACLMRDLLGNETYKKVAGELNQELGVYIERSSKHNEWSTTVFDQLNESEQQDSYDGFATKLRRTQSLPQPLPPPRPWKKRLPVDLEYEDEPRIAPPLEAFYKSELEDKLPQDMRFQYGPLPLEILFDKNTQPLPPPKYIPLKDKESKNIRPPQKKLLPVDLEFESEFKDMRKNTLDSEFESLLPTNKKRRR